MPDARTIRHYHEFLKRYAATVFYMAQTPRELKRLIKGQNLSEEEEALRKHIEQFK